MATAGNECRSFGVFWDIENCRVPKGGSARELVGRIRKKLYKPDLDKEAEFMCVCDASKENKELMKELNSAQVTIVHVDATNKNAADEKLRQRMRYFVETHKPPATVVLISGDVNFEGLLSDIQHRNQLDAILIHPDRINEGLRQCVQQRFPYAEFINKLPSRQTSTKSVEHDCIIHGLPSGRDNKALSARLHQLSENCGGKVLTVAPPRAKIRFKDLELAERARGRMNGEDVFGSKIRVDIAPTPVESHFSDQYNNCYHSPKSKSARKKLRKKRGSKSALDYHSSDGSGNSPQSSPQGSPKSSPYRQRSPGRSHLIPAGGNSPLHGSEPQRLAMPPKSYADLHDQFHPETRETRSESPTPFTSPASSLPLQPFCNGKFSPAHPHSSCSSSHQEDGDSEMENLPWNQKGKPSCSPKVEQLERHHSFTPTSYVYKKQIPPRNRTLSDPPLRAPHRQPTPDRCGQNHDSPSRTFYRQPNFSPQLNSPFRDPRGRNSPAFRGVNPGRRFSRSRSNSSNRSNRSSPSLSDSGDRFSADTLTSDPSYLGGSPTYVGHSQRESTSEGSTSFPSSPQGAFHLRVTNLDSKKDEKELKGELKKHFQRHAKVEDISIEYQPDDSLVGIVKVSTLKAAERAAAKLHRATKIGCKRIHVYLKHHPPVTDEVKANVIELLQEVPGCTLKWFKFVDLYEKKYKSRVTLSDVQQMSDEVMLLNEEQTGHSVQLTCPVPSTRQEMTGRWGSPGPARSAFTPQTTPLKVGAPSPRPAARPQSAGVVLDTPPSRKFEQQVGESDLCSLHCPAGSTAAQGLQDTHGLPSVHLHRKTFAAQVHTLLLGHEGSMPLKSFQACYLAEFAAPQPGEVPLEHLISSIPGIEITASGSPVRHIRWAANKGKASVPHLTHMLAQLAEEVVEVLSSVPCCMLSLAEFLPKYQSMFQKPCCFTDYGHTSLQQLIEAMPQVVQVFGWGSSRQVALTHPVQMRRFLSDVVAVLRVQPQWQVTLDQLPNAFGNVFRKGFNVSDYGACYVEDLIADLPGNIILVSDKDGVQRLRLTRQEVLLDLEERVTAMLRGRDQGLALPVFLTTFHACHGINLSLSDYDVASVRELVQLIPTSVTIERKSGRDLIRLLDESTHHVKSQRARQVLAAYPDQVLSSSDFSQRYRALYGQSMEVTELRTILYGVAEVTYDETGEGPNLVHVLTADTVCRNLRSVLEQQGSYTTVANLWAAYSETYSSPPALLGFSSLQQFLTARPEFTLFKGDGGLEYASLSSTSVPDTSENRGSCKPASSAENAPQRLQIRSTTSSPKIKKLNHFKEDSQPKDEAVPLEDSLRPCHSEVAVKNCKLGSSQCVSSEKCTGMLSTLGTVGVAPMPPRSLEAVKTVESSSLTKAFVTGNPPVTASGDDPLGSLPKGSCSSSPPEAAPLSGQQLRRSSCSSSSRVASSRPGSRTASNSSGSPLGSPLQYPGTPRRNRLAAKFTNPILISPSPPLQSDSDV